MNRAMRSPGTRATGLLLLAALCAPLAEGAPDTVYVNGKIITVDDQFAVVEGLAISGERISATGGSEAMLALADRETRIVDLEGRAVLPGLIDNHNHFIRGAQHWRRLARLDGVTSKRAALRLLEAVAARLEGEQWLLALGGWNEEQFGEADAGFTLAELDSLAPRRPVFLQAQYDHAYVNSAFLDYYGIPARAAAPAAGGAAARMDLEALLESGGEAEPRALAGALGPLVRRDASGAATGYLSGDFRMVAMVTNSMPAPSREAMLAGVRSAQRHYNSLGLTAVYDPGGGLIDERAYAAVEAVHSAGELTLRVFRTRQFMPSGPEDAGRAARRIAAMPPMLTGDHYYDTLALGEVFYTPLQMLDGLGERAPLPAEHEAPVRLMLESALRRGVPVQIHAVRSETIGLYLRLLEELSRKYTLYPSQIALTHAELVTGGQLARIGDLGISLQLRSMQLVRSRASLVADYGPGATAVPPLRAVQDSGVNWGLGTDGTKAAQIDPLATLEWAVTGRAINGDQVLDEGQRITRREALIAHTRGNARMLFRSDSLGQIRAGFLADFIVLDGDYLTVAPESIGELEVLRTVVGGRVVHDTGALGRAVTRPGR